MALTLHNLRSRLALALGGKNLNSLLRSRLAGNEDDGGTGSVFAMRDDGDYLGATARSSWVYACVNAVANGLATPDWWFEVAQGRGERRKAGQRVDVPGLAALLEAPNPFLTGSELLYVTGCHLELCGKAYWFLPSMTALDMFETEKDAAGVRYVKLDAAGQPKLRNPGNPLAGAQPSSIWYLPPNCVTPKVGKAGTLFESFTYEPQPGKKYDIPAAAMVYFRRLDPNSMTDGLGVIEASRTVMEMDYRAVEWNIAYFRRGARPSGTLQTDQVVTEEQAQRMVEAFKQRYAGQANAHKIPLLHSGVKFVADTASPKDMEWVELRRMNKSEILAMFGVPPALVGDFSESKSFANTQEQENYFWRHAMAPLQALVADRITKDLLPRFTAEPCRFVWQDMVQADLQAESAAAQRLITTGSMSPDEVRERFGWGEPLPNGAGAKHYIMSNLVALEDGGPGVPAASSVSPPPGASAPAAGEGETLPETGPAEGAEAAPKAAYTCSHKHPRPWRKSLSDAEQQHHEGEFRRSTLKWFQGVERSVMAALPAALEEVAQETITRPLTKDPSPDDLADLVGTLTDWEGEQERLAVALEPKTRRTLQVSGENALAELGLEVAFDVSNPAVVAWLEGYLPRLAGSVAETTRRAIADTLAAGLAAGDTAPALQDRVRAVFREAKNYRCEMIARSESARAATQGDIAAWRQSSIVTGKVWSAAPDCCEFCQEMDGKVVGLEEPFFEQGETLVVDGKPMVLDYEDVAGPPIHPNCRCLIEARLEGD